MNVMQPILFLSRPIQSTILTDCIKRFPFEACGFLIGNKGYCKSIFEVSEVINQSPNLNKYEIDPFDFYTVEKSLTNKNLSIIGFYHSHPHGSPHPSRYDIQDAWLHYSYIIVSVDDSHSCAMKSWLIDAKTGQSDEETICIM